ncbi:cyanophycinase [Sphingobium sp. YR768]|uniref:cyanophycinase n=1 Tax=Sphingobium sp. YR768 TaxID=1884365 RepID=UPI0008CE2411|nr:cyanophycinase [Sphingobium sp. YR768]SER60761.1 cyanophycinase [Sphingobium sp. YR768]
MRRALGAAIALAAMVLSISGAQAKEASYRHYQLGKLTTPTPDPVSGGLLLLGGGDRNADAMKWFFAKAGHGHIVILRASQKGQIGEEFYHKLGGIQSAETFVFADRSAATDPKILASLKHADGIFIAGGDQARYVRFWRGTPVAEALDAHVAAGKPLAGTSAGLAMLGEKLYGAMDDGSITSAEALAAPFGPANTIEGDFLHLTLLKGIVTDTHFKERDRLGRLFAFVAKAQVGRPMDQPAMLGLGVDESASLAVEPDGAARIYATDPQGGAWLVDGAALRNLPTQGPLNASAISVTGIGAGSVVHLPQGSVDRPTFERLYEVQDGQMRLSKDGDRPLP